MDFKLIRGCNVSKIAQLKYRGFCCFSWELISHHKDVLLVRLPVSTVSPSIVLTLLSAADLQAKGVTPGQPAAAVCAGAAAAPRAQGPHRVCLAADVRHVV